MQPQRHYVSGFFAQRGLAQDAYDQFIGMGMKPDQMGLYQSQALAPEPALPLGSTAVLERVIVDAGIGTVAGTLLGGLAEIALVAANVSLFIAAPLVTPLVMLGWGASLGGLIGAVKGAMPQPPSESAGWLTDLVRDATAAGQAVLVVQTDTEDETALARKTMQAAVGHVGDVAVALG